VSVIVNAVKKIVREGTEGKEETKVEMTEGKERWLDKVNVRQN
jgi:hypothetical protein